ncbi:hypothetical protein [uncultured Amnibacterium sp.]|uniref:hypothetical protein n=1 Tax=uncultured Amnibacterium sp. TaxID=1631851 RepID=UPI0035CB9AFC
MRVPKLLVAAAIGVAVLPLTACASAAPPPREAEVVVRIEPSAQPAAYEVHLTKAGGDFRAVHTMRSGETRRFAVPKGWMTVRVAGVCVVPTAASGTSTIEVRPNDCRLD